MTDHPIKELMDTTMEKIRNMVDVNTIIGNPITTKDGSTIIPVSTVSYGFASGGSDLPSKHSTDTKTFFGGGSGAGISIKPIAFLCVSSSGEVRMINIDAGEASSVERLADLVPSVIEKVSSVFKKDKKVKSEENGKQTVDVDTVEPVSETDI